MTASGIQIAGNSYKLTFLDKFGSDCIYQEKVLTNVQELCYQFSKNISIGHFDF